MMAVTIKDLPEFQAHKKYNRLSAAITEAKPFHIDTYDTCCLLIIPLSKCALSIIDKGKRKVDTVETPFSLNFIPANKSLCVEQHLAVENLYLMIDHSYLYKHGLDGLCKCSKSIRPILGYSSPDISLVAQSLRFHLFAEHPFTSLFIKALTNLLIVHVVTASSRFADMQASAKRLQRSTLKKTLDYIENSLDQRISIAQLAEISNMPPYAFTRAFRASIGQSPNQYIIERRITLARSLLTRDDVSLAEIAYSSGFSSQSHMTDVFRQKLGVTPGQYRRELLSR